MRPTSRRASVDSEAFRKARSPAGLNREISNVTIVTFGDDCGLVTLEFRRNQTSGGPSGRQSQVWRKFPEGWIIGEPDLVVQFLLFDPHSPRSLRYGTETVKEHLERIAGEPGAAARLVGRLHAELCYHDGAVTPGTCRTGPVARAALSLIRYERECRS